MEDKEIGAQGAAIAAGIAAGVYRDFDDALSRTVHISRTIQPRKEYKEIYEKKYQTYRRVIDGLSGVWGCFEN